MTLEEILTLAIDSNSSDIHIEQNRKCICVQTRQFGVLKLLGTLETVNPIINRIKIRANLDLSETRRTQEGQFSFSYKMSITYVRVSIISTIRGEKIALRLLPEKTHFTLESIGLPEELKRQLIDTLALQNGLILVCGATGAGYRGKSLIG